MAMRDVFHFHEKNNHRHISLEKYSLEVKNFKEDSKASHANVLMKSNFKKLRVLNNLNTLKIKYTLKQSVCLI